MLKTFNVDLPVTLGESDFHLTARLIEASQHALAAKAKDSRFYMVFYPGCELVPRMRAHVRQNAVTLLDYSKLIDWPDPEYRIEGDLHPTPLAHQRVAQQLAKDVFPD